MSKVTDDQVKQLQGMVQELVEDKNDADAKTQISNDADTAEKQAAAIAAQAKLDEAAADAKASAKLADIVTFVDSLVAPDAPPA